MKKIYFVIITILLFYKPANTSAQQFEWVHSSPVNYVLNPDMPQHFLGLGGGMVIHAKMTSYVLDFGIDIMGEQKVECYDSTGWIHWAFDLGDSVVIRSMAVDPNGNIYVSGLFMNTLTLDGNDTLRNNGFGYNQNVFFISIDINGTLRWKRNLSVENPDVVSIPAIAIDHNNDCWYSLFDFNISSVRKIDNTGQDILTYNIGGGNANVSSLSFDSNNNLFLAGACGSGTITIGSVSATTIDAYNMLFARINSAGVASWIKFGHDVTFQSPEIVATTNGDAFIASSLMDSLVLGSVILEGPQWVYDIFLTKVDSSGNFAWGVEVPSTPTISGDFQRGRNKFISSDPTGNVYLTGNGRGTVDWGNGVVTSNPSSFKNIDIISFDNNGLPRWQTSGGCDVFNVAYGILMPNQDNGYFVGAVNSSSTFGTINTNGVNQYASVIGKIISGSPTSVNDISSNGIKLFPSPANDKLFIESDNDDLSEIKISNSLGQVVLTKQLSGNKSVIYLSDLESGIYFIELRSAASSVSTQKLIKE